jgi:hypothetical protein
VPELPDVPDVPLLPEVPVTPSANNAYDAVNACNEYDEVYAQLAVAANAPLGRLDVIAPYKSVVVHQPELLS